MNRDTQRIADLLGVDLQTAVRIQSLMGQNGLDFSGCTQREFEDAANAAQIELGRM